MIKNITILGTGAMGSRIASNLIKQNYCVSVYNRNKDRAAELIKSGASYFDTPGKAVANADLIISMLSNDDAANSVWLNDKSGALYAMKNNAIAIESSTLSVDCIKHLHFEFSKHNKSFLDAPVLGSRPQAESASLIFLVSGDESHLNKIYNVLEKLSSAIHYLGESSNAAAMKLAVNAYFSTQVSALCESFNFLEKCGIDKMSSLKIFNQLPTTSPALQGIGQLIANENHQPFFPIKLVEKDLSYALNLAKHVKAKIPTISKSHQCFQLAIQKGFENDNISGLMQIFE